MYIAICDDDVADRKQSERLMGREADKWIKNGDPLYVYSFGSTESLLLNMMQYDGILIDIKLGADTREAIEKLKAAGTSSPFVACCAQEYFDKTDLPEDVYRLEKPIQPAKLHEMMEVLKERTTHYVAKIELRGEKVTLYVDPEEVFYAEQSGMYTEVTLSEGRKVRIHGDAVTFFDEIQEKHPEFIMPSFTKVLNIEQVKSLKLGKAYLKDGSVMKIQHSAIRYTKDAMALLEKGLKITRENLISG